MTNQSIARAPVVRWPSRAGAWLGIGTSPGALVLGAGIAARHEGPAPLIALLLGVTAMVVMLAVQGLLGVAAPAGEGDTLLGLADRYLQRSSARALGVLLSIAMIGWMGFNTGLGGAALGALIGLPSALGTALLGGSLTVLSLGGMQRWNKVAIVTTTCALVLSGLVAARLAAPTSPVNLAMPPLGLLLADVSAFIGWIAVFSLRAPDFSAGLASRRDLWICVLLLVTPTLLIALVGSGLWLGTGSSDLVWTLARPGGLALGNLLIAAAFIGPILATLYSGALALRSLTPLGSTPAVLWIAVPGIVLGMVRFDRLLLAWLSLLAAALPALLVAMAAEGARRRRQRAGKAPHRPPQRIPLWAWLPGTLVAVPLTASGMEAAPLLGVAIALATTGYWYLRTGT